MWLLSFYASAASFRLKTRSHQVRVAFMGRAGGGKKQQGSEGLGI